MSSRTRALAVTCLALAAACSTEQAPSTVTTDSAGIRLVSNPAEDTPLDWTFVPSFRLGGANEGPEAFYSANAGTVKTDAASNIYVLDASAHRVIVFDSSGNHLRTLGREGNGPGELAQPWGLSVSPGGTVYVDDFGNSGIVAFDPDGQPLPREERLRGSRREWVGDGVYTQVRDSIDRLLFTSEGDTTELARIAVERDDRMIALKSCGISFSGIPPVFAPSIAWDAGPGGMVVRTGVEYQIDVFAGARLTARHSRAIEPQEVTPELAAREIGEGMTVGTPGGDRQCETDEVVEHRGFAARMPTIRHLRLAPDGTIWVSRGGPRPENTATDIFAPDGTYVGTLPADVPYPIGFLADGRVLVAETDDVDVSRLVVYRVKEMPSGFEPE